jgi:ankyrin repeat protein
MAGLPFTVRPPVGTPPICQMLIGHNADVHIRSNSGESPLHWATNPSVTTGHVDTMQVLLDNGADPNARDENGSTPLHFLFRQNWGSFNGSVQGARLLIKHGAIIDAEDNEGRTPLQLALEHGHDEIATCLIEHGAAR